MYPEYRQLETAVTPLKEEDAYPAAPQDRVRWEKLFSELACSYYTGEFGLVTRVARFHNIYGPFGTYDGGREKAPAALCRKVALAPDGGAIEIWGDGQQTRSFCYIDDCVEGIHRLMQSDYDQPLNLGSDRMVTIDELARLVMAVAGKELDIVHVDGPQGVRGETPTTRVFAKYSAGSHRRHSRTDSPRRIAGSKSKSTVFAEHDLADGAAQRVDVLGVAVDAIDMQIAVERIACWIATREQHYVCVTGVHGVMEAQDDAELLRIHNPPV